MQKKSKDPSRERKPPEADTTSYEQSQGAPEGVAPHRRNERMPHERDESASATGNRLDEHPVPSDRQISQAHDDVEGGLVDTDRRGVPNDLPKSE